MNKQTRFIALSVMVGALACGARAPAGDITLIKDITRTGFSSSPTGFFELAPDKILFSAADGTAGREPWITDGTNAGTLRLKDLVAGAGDSNPGVFRRVGNRAFFAAIPQQCYLDIWSTDGTSDGTVLAARWYGGCAPGQGMAGQVGNGVIFNATLNNVAGLYFTDGTPGETVLLASGCTASTSITPVQLGAVLLFVGNTSAAGSELWRTDGTPSGTQIVRDIATGTSSAIIGPMAAFNGSVYFSATTSQSGAELWRSDGTGVGTVQVAEIAPGSQSSAPQSLVVSGGKLYFTATTLTNGLRHVFAYSGTSAPVRVYEQLAHNGQGVVQSPVPFQGGVAFAAPLDDGAGSQTWAIMTSQGAPDDAGPIFSASVSDAGSTPLALPIADTPGGLVYRRSYFPFGLWSVADPDAPPALLLGGNSVTAYGLVGNRVLLSNPATTGSEIEYWTTDGTTAGTALLARAASSASGRFLVLSDGRAMYDRNTVAGDEPWITDSDGDRLLRDIDIRTSGSSLAAAPTLGGRCYFYVSSGGNGAVNLWSSGGTPNTTALAIDPGALSPGQTMQAAGNTILNDRLLFSTSYFDSSTYHYSNYLYSTDGTMAGTTQLLQYSGSFSPCCSVPLIGSLETVGNEAWFTLATAVYRISDVPGAAAQLITSRLPAVQLAQRAGPGVLYSYNSGGSSRTVWYCDGTDTGTIQLWTYPCDGYYNALNSGSTAYITTYSSGGNPSVSQLYATNGSAPRLVLDNIGYATLYFVGDLGRGDVAFFASPIGGTPQLYRTTGGGTGATALAPLRSPCSHQTDSALLNGVLYFAASLTATNGELWRTDGTPAGTYLVADLAAGASSSCPRQFFSDGQSVYFTASTLSNVSEVWKTDGTAAGTVRIAALPRGTSTTDLDFLGASADGVFLAADNPLLGNELHVYRPGQPDCNHNFIHDGLEIALGIARDANGDGWPDECCRADFNSDGTLTAQDIFDFLGTWFAGDPSADFNGGGLGVQDIFDFLTAWFAGCP